MSNETEPASPAAPPGSPAEIIVGIDLGTTNSAIGYVKDGKPCLIPIDGEKTMPSCVGLSESGEILVGRAALNQFAVAAERTVASIKRKMGSEIPVTLGDRSYRPEEISAFILRRLKTEAEAHLERPVSKAVITVPAWFDEHQRQATRSAARAAGLDPVRILNEPTAAALAYSLDSTETQTVLVYDLGGGTFDVSLVRTERDLVEVKASHGDTHLGGDDFDDVLLEKVCEKAGLSLDELKKDWSAWRRLELACEKAKCRLSSHPFAEIHEDYLLGDAHLNVEISRPEFEELIEPLLEKTWSSLAQAMRDAGATPASIDKILLAGGSSRIPLIHDSIAQRVGIEPSSEVNPDLVVALGAAIQGGLIAGEDLSSILVDIATHTYSIESLFQDHFETLCAPIIPRGTALPVARSEAFRTVHDGQTEVEIRAYQGETPYPEENTRLGEFRVEGLSRVPAGNRVIVEFALDLNGLLKVTATEKSTGLAKSVEIDTHESFTNIDLAEAQRRVAEAFGDDVEDGEVLPDAEEASAGPGDLLARAKDLKKRAETLMAGDLADEDKTDINSLLRKSADAVKSGDHDRLEDLSNQLDDILFYLE